MPESQHSSPVKERHIPLPDEYAFVEKEKDSSEIWDQFRAVLRKDQQERMAFCAQCGGIVAGNPDKEMLEHVKECAETNMKCSKHSGSVNLRGVKRQKVSPSSSPKTKSQKSPPDPRNRLKYRIAKYMKDTQSGLLEFGSIVDYAWKMRGEEGVCEWLDVYNDAHLNKPAPDIPVTLCVNDWSFGEHKKVYGVVLMQNGRDFLQDVILLDSVPSPEELLDLVMKSLKGVSLQMIVALVVSGGIDLVRLRALFAERNPAFFQLSCVEQLVNCVCRTFLHNCSWQKAARKSVGFLRMFAKHRFLMKNMGLLTLKEKLDAVGQSSTSIDRFRYSYKCLSIMCSIDDDRQHVCPLIRADITITPEKADSLMTPLNHTVNRGVACRVTKSVFAAVKAIQDPDADLSICFCACVTMIKDVMSGSYSSSADISAGIVFEPIYEMVVEQPVFLLAAFLDLRVDLKFKDAVMEVVRAEYKRLMSLQGKSLEELEVWMRRFEGFVKERDELTVDSIAERPEYKEVMNLSNYLHCISPRSASTENGHCVMECVSSARKSGMDDVMVKRIARLFYATNQESAVDSKGHNLQSLLDPFEKLISGEVADLPLAERAWGPPSPLPDSRPLGNVLVRLNSLFEEFPSKRVSRASPFT